MSFDSTQILSLKETMLWNKLACSGQIDRVFAGTPGVCPLGPVSLILPFLNFTLYSRIVV
jgi:hypothetical protein